MKKVSLGDVSFEIEDRGQGVPLLLVHGFPLDHTMWSGQIDALADDFRVIAPDLRGFGQTQSTAELGSPLTMEQHADDLARLMNQLMDQLVDQLVDQSSKFVYCGLSMGGYVGWQFWSRHRERLAGLILCDTRAAADSSEAAEGRRQLGQRVLAEGASVVVEAMVGRLFANATINERPDFVRQQREVMLNTDPQSIAAALLGMAEREDFTDRLTEIDIPSLLICGEEDQITPADEMASIAEAMPNARFVKIPQAGHMAPLEQPDVVNEAIRGFLP